MTEVFKACALQFDIENGDLDANMAWVENQVKMLAEEGVFLVVLPELFSTGFDNEQMVDHARSTPGVLEQLQGWAKTHAMALAGSVPELVNDEDPRVYNTLYFIDRDGELKGQYRKTHLFPLTGEPDYYRPGDEVVVVESSLGPVGLMICYDLRFPELARELFLKGAKMILTPAQWPRTRIGHWDILARARAVENQVFMICANRTGNDGELIFSGGSQIVDPMGNVLDRAGENDSIARAEIDLAQVARARRLIPVGRDRRADIYGRKDNE